MAIAKDRESVEQSLKNEFAKEILKEIFKYLWPLIIPTVGVVVMVVLQGFQVTRHGYMNPQPCTRAGINAIYTRMQASLIGTPDSATTDRAYLKTLNELREWLARDSTVTFSLGAWFLDPPSGVAVGSTTVTLNMGHETTWMEPWIFAAGKTRINMTPNLQERPNVLEVAIEQPQKGEPIFVVIPYRGSAIGVNKSDYDVKFSNGDYFMASVDAFGSVGFELWLAFLLVAMFAAGHRSASFMETFGHYTERWGSNVRKRSSKKRGK